MNGTGLLLARYLRWSCPTCCCLVTNGDGSRFPVSLGNVLPVFASNENGRMGSGKTETHS